MLGSGNHGWEDRPGDEIGPGDVLWKFWGRGYQLRVPKWETRERMEEGRTYGLDDTAHLGTLGLMESDRHVVRSTDIVNCISTDVSLKRSICGGKDPKDSLRIPTSRFWAKSSSWVSASSRALPGVETSTVTDLV